MLLCEALCIQKGLTAVIGGGGKTSTINRLANELVTQGTVLVCTTTHYRKPPMHSLVNPSESEVRMAFLDGNNPIAVYSICEDGKCGPCEALMPKLTALADYVLVEADGSRGLPLKAPASHEPVIPSETSHVIAVCGIDGINRPISEVCHRPQLYASLVKKQITDYVTASDIATVLTSVEGQRKDVSSCFSILINKADTIAAIDDAYQVFDLCTEQHVVIAALHSNDPVIDVKVPAQNRIGGE